MKKLTLPTILLFTSSLLVQAAEAPATKSGSVSAEAQKQLEAYGWIIGKQAVDGSTAQFGFTEAEKEFVIKGIINGSKNIGISPLADKEAGPKLEAFLEAKASEQQKKTEAETAKQAEANKEAAKGFFEKLAKESSKVKKTVSGLYYEILKEGSKEKPNEKSIVKIDYVGKLIDGTEFDSSKKRGQPATFSLEQVIPGFKEGLQLIGKGGTIRLYVPSDLAYGDKALPGIPAGSTLIFDVDMLDLPPVETAGAKSSPSEAGK